MIVKITLATVDENGIKIAGTVKVLDEINNTVIVERHTLKQKEFVVLQGHQERDDYGQEGKDPQDDWNDEPPSDE